MREQKEKPSALFKMRLTTFLISALFLAVTLSSTVFFIFFCRIQDVDVVGLAYSDKEKIISAADIKTGTHLYSISKEKIESRIKASNPYVADVRIKRTGPTSISLILTEEAPRFYCKNGEKYLVLSGTLRVLTLFDNESEARAAAPCELLLPDISEAKIGSTVVFSDAYDGSRTTEAIEKILASSISEDITFFDAHEKFDIRFTYKDKYEVRFGAFGNIEENLPLVINTVAYLENEANGYALAAGIIHASTPGQTSFETTGTLANDK